MESEATEVTRLRPFLVILLLAMAIGGAVDLALDAPQEWLSLHVVFEVLLVALSLGSTLYLGLGWYRARRNLHLAVSDLGRKEEERDAWRTRAQRLLAGLGEAIDGQLAAWNLTPAERQTALFLLKGLSHRDIARLTDRSERTVRQHSVEVYRKSGLRGRAELSAFFLEDLLLPVEETEISEEY